jgi:hypothetical protein
MVQVRLGQKQDPISKITSQVPVVYGCNPSYLRGRDKEDGSSKLARTSSSGDPISKIPNTKMVQVVEGLCSKCEALSSNPVTNTKKTKPNQNKKNAQVVKCLLSK